MTSPAAFTSYSYAVLTADHLYGLSLRDGKETLVPVVLSDTGCVRGCPPMSKNDANVIVAMKGEGFIAVRLADIPGLLET